jgi:hypothetical protein
MAIWKVKSCLRCGGDMFVDRDIYGWYEKCLQCGYCSELRYLDDFVQNPVLKDKRPVDMPGHEPGGW